MFIFFKMESVGSTSITIGEAVSYVVADPGSDVDNFSSESVSSEPSDDGRPLSTVAIPNNQRTRGGSRAALAAKKEMKHKQRN